MERGHEGTKTRRHEGKRRAFVPLIPLIPLILTVSGCITTPPEKANSHPVTDIDPKQATGDYWLDKPAVTQIDDADFYKLWNACREELHSRFFIIDREDYRDGMLTTLPLVSKQALELWRRDAVTVEAISESTLATIRRTVRFQLTKREDGSFTATPRVLVERWSSTERRLTAIYEVHSAYSGPRPIADVQTDRGVVGPADYWYATARDEDLERDLATAIKQRLR
jgi:hypothetical protein